MKKITAIALVLIMLLCASACSKQPAEAPDDNNAAAATPLEVLNTVWASYTDEEKFPAAGGDYSEENANMEGPGKYSIEDAAALDASLGYPAASIDLIDDAASLMHMMNANNFTCGAYHAKDSATVGDIASALEQNIQSRQWMCGFPEKLLIVTIDDVILAAFGSEENMTNFKAKVTAAYAEASVVCDAPIE